MSVHNVDYHLKRTLPQKTNKPTNNKKNKLQKIPNKTKQFWSIDSSCFSKED